nr:MAG TPA: hypothetical protein [Caudoviricetes sp.]
MSNEITHILNLIGQDEKIVAAILSIAALSPAAVDRIDKCVPILVHVLNELRRRTTLLIQFQILLLVIPCRDKDPSLGKLQGKDGFHDFLVSRHKDEIRNVLLLSASQADIFSIVGRPGRMNYFLSILIKDRIIKTLSLIEPVEMATIRILNSSLQFLLVIIGIALAYTREPKNDNALFIHDLTLHNYIERSVAIIGSLEFDTGKRNSLSINLHKAVNGLLRDLVLSRLNSEDVQTNSHLLKIHFSSSYSFS